MISPQIPAALDINEPCIFEWGGDIWYRCPKPCGVLFQLPDNWRGDIDCPGCDQIWDEKELLLMAGYEAGDGFGGLLEQLKADEGFMSKPYADSVGVMTIGYGRSLEKGITEEEAEYLLRNDATEAMCYAERYQWFEGLSQARRDVVVNMIFNLGPSRFATFKKAIAAIAQGDFDAAAYEMLQSRWAVQVGNRATRLAQEMREG